MSKPEKPSRPEPQIKLTREGVLQIKSTSDGGIEEKIIARPISLRAVGIRESDEITFAEIRFQTMHGKVRTELFEWSSLLPGKRHEIKARLADLGYEWPENAALANAILRTVARCRPTQRFLLVRAPRW